MLRSRKNFVNFERASPLPQRPGSGPALDHRPRPRCDQTRLGGILGCERDMCIVRLFYDINPVTYYITAMYLTESQSS